jgi:hypothetical protein
MQSMLKYPRFSTDNADARMGEEKLPDEQQETSVKEPESGPELLARFCKDDRRRDSEELGEGVVFDDEGYDDGENEVATAENELEEKEELGTDVASGQGDVSVIDPRTIEIVREINQIAIRTVEKGQLEIGQYVLERVFKGDIKKVLTKNPNKSQSLRMICEAPDLMVDRRRLGSWVRGAALRFDLEANGVEVSGLNFSHLLVLLGVSKAEKRLELAQRVVTEKLSVRQTRDEVNASGRKATTRDKGEDILKRLSDPLRLIEDESFLEFVTDRERLTTELDSEARLRLIKAIGLRKRDIGQCNQVLDSAKKHLVAIEMESLDVETA